MRTRHGGYQSGADGLTFHIRLPREKRPRAPPSPSPSPSAKRARLAGPAPPPAAALLDLPDDVLSLVMVKLSESARTAADLINAMLSCRRLCALGGQEGALRAASAGALSLSAARWADGAHRFLRKCAQAGSREAAFRLGMIKFYCLEDRRGGASLMARAAMAGHAEALYCLAVIHFNGSGGTRCDRDLASGVILCAKAAAQGHVEALRELGHCLQDGYGLPRNVPEGRRLLLEANAREAAQLAARPPPASVRKEEEEGQQGRERERERQGGAGEGAGPRPAYVRTVSGPLPSVPSLATSGALGSPAEAPPPQQQQQQQEEEEAAGKDTGRRRRMVDVPVEQAGTGHWLAGGGGLRHRADTHHHHHHHQQQQQQQQQRVMEGGAPSPPQQEGEGRGGGRGAHPIAEARREGAACECCERGACQSVHHFLADWHLHGHGRPPPAAEEALRRCGNAGCGRAETRPQEFRCCSACERAKYCSRSCQARSWRAGHKRACALEGGPAMAAMAVMAAVGAGHAVE